ncbi:hypothetical protein IW261DRAFT_1568516 [Armillaria novae-zelandiae]|uniref:Uncharacterized protein n=1 Tax=Armillaria novae-zelandiae TaxID=153914 RepID=A0AA39NZE6_9AGAR|nr:hypothetical protein IW261DRAFT_1568516 [Armillaria novae-zelandiae]
MTGGRAGGRERGAKDDEEARGEELIYKRKASKKHLHDRSSRQNDADLHSGGRAAGGGKRRAASRERQGAGGRERQGAAESGERRAESGERRVGASGEWGTRGKRQGAAGSSGERRAESGSERGAGNEGEAAESGKREAGSGREQQGAAESGERERAGSEGEEIVVLKLVSECNRVAVLGKGRLGLSRFSSKSQSAFAEHSHSVALGNQLQLGISQSAGVLGKPFALAFVPPLSPLAPAPCSLPLPAASPSLAARRSLPLPAALRSPLSALRSPLPAALRSPLPAAPRSPLPALRCPLSLPASRSLLAAPWPPLPAAPCRSPLPAPCRPPARPPIKSQSAFAEHSHSAALGNQLRLGISQSAGALGKPFALAFVPLLRQKVGPSGWCCYGGTKKKLSN